MPESDTDLWRALWAKRQGLAQQAKQAVDETVPAAALTAVQAMAPPGPVGYLASRALVNATAPQPQTLQSGATAAMGPAVVPQQPDMPDYLAQQEAEAKAAQAPPAGAGGGGTPGGWHPSSHEVKTEGAVPIPPELSQQFANAYGLQARGLAGQFAGQMGMHDADAEAAKARAPIEQAFSEQAGRLQESKDKLIGSYRNVIEKLHQEVRDAKVDPRRYFSSMPAGQKFLTGLGVILGEFHTGNGPHVNGVVDLLVRHMDADTQEQLREIEGKAKYAGHVENALSGLMGIFGDAQQSMLMLRSLKLAAVEQDLARRRAMATGALERANLDNAMGQLAYKKAETQLELQKLSAGKHEDTFKEAYKLPTAGGGGTPRPDAGGPTDEEVAGAYKEYAAAKLPDLDTAVDLMASTVGKSGAEFQRLMETSPGYTTHLINQALTGKSGMSVAQRRMFAKDIIGYVQSGAQIPEPEAQRLQEKLATGDPDAVATTMSIINTFRGNREKALAAGMRGYSVMSRNLRALRGVRPSRQGPANAPSPTMAKPEEGSRQQLPRARPTRTGGAS